MWYEINKNPTSQNFWLIVGRALFGCCPSCGKGRLFTTYLKQVEHCTSMSVLDKLKLMMDQPG